MKNFELIATEDLPPGAVWGFRMQLWAFHHWKRMDAALSGDPVAMAEHLGYYGA